MQHERRTGRRGERAGDSAEPVDWRRFLAAGTSREVLARLVDGDPLGVRACVAARLRAGAYLLDAEGTVSAALACVARLGCVYRGRPEFPTWLAERCDEAISGQLASEREALESAVPVALPDAFRLLAGPLAVEPEHARRACAALNDRPLDERRAFFALVLDAEPLDRASQRLGCTPTVLARRARAALRAALDTEDREPEALP